MNRFYHRTKILSIFFKKNQGCCRGTHSIIRDIQGYPRGEGVQDQILIYLITYIIVFLPKIQVLEYWFLKPKYSSINGTLIKNRVSGQECYGSGSLKNKDSKIVREAIEVIMKYRPLIPWDPPWTPLGQYFIRGIKGPLPPGDSLPAAALSDCRVLASTRVTYTTI